MQSNLPPSDPEVTAGNLQERIYGRARKSPMFLLLLLLMLPVGIFAIQKATSFFSQAQTPANVSVSFTPGGASIPPSREVKINFNAGSNQLAFARVVFTFDKSKVKLTGDITTTPNMSTTVQKSTASQANTAGKAIIIVASSPSDTKPSGSFQFASFTIDAVSPNAGPSNVSFSVSEMQIVNVGGTVLTVSPTNLAVNGATGAGGDQNPGTVLVLPSPNPNPQGACTNIASVTCFTQWIREFNGIETTKYSDKLVDNKIDLRDFEKIRRALHP